ncbi:kinase-like domain, phloem protein 2-like protein [Tanacetum coccineum]
MWARRCRPRTNPIRAIPFHLSRATCRPGMVSPATSRPGYPGFVAGEYSKCCCDYRDEKLEDLVEWNLWKQIDPQSFKVFTEIAYDCLNEEPSQRPDINEIITKLEKALELARVNQPWFDLVVLGGSVVVILAVLHDICVSGDSRNNGDDGVL